MTSVQTESVLATARAVAEAALTVLPTATALSVGVPTTDPMAVALDGVAVTARLEGPAEGLLAVVVNGELVEAMRTSPLGELDLGQAVAPALVAAAGVLGAVPGPAQEVAADVVGGVLLEVGDAVFVPLLADGELHAVVALAVPAEDVAEVVEEVPAAAVAIAAPREGGLELLHGVEMEVTAELGRTRLTVRELLSLSNGAVIELDRAAGSPADLLVNGRLIARGEVVVIDENFGIRVTEIIKPGDGSQEVR
ncbi:MULTISPECIES: flagellar motor switch protein FliN [Actinosynnema]|uniref:flagellar motor switch protein FliN n=1 Tax=Actinosynnema TaxID=40566 RepID=UPI0020A27E88|nr:flagellar motor switch protein FliN [Actinosynnema pretiosum]MCP2099515.1 flagellar motor switch protein FliN/FliY [Actinosynnema pretiosum]